MRDIIFHEVGMENFGPYIDPMVLKFENNKITLITGPNGIGKTMSLEALPFTLYGETCKKARGDDVVNTRIGKNCHTWVMFSINDDDYRVDRYHKYSKLGTTVTIVRNDEDSPYKKGHREVVPEIERLICSKKSFMNTLMFGQKVKDFFTDLVDSDKKEIFRKILDLDIYTKWYKEADNNLKEIKEKLATTIEQIGINKGILSDIEVQIKILFKQMNQFEENKNESLSNLRKKLEENKRLLDSWKIDETDLSETNDKVQKLQSEISKLENQLSNYESEKRNALLKLQNGHDSKLSELREMANEAIQKVIAKYRELYEKLNQDHAEQIKQIVDSQDGIKAAMSNNSSKLAQLSTEKRICQNDIDTLNESLEIEGGVCPTCLQAIDDDCRKHLEEEVQNLVNNYQEFERQEKAIQEFQDNYQKLLNDSNEKQRQQNEKFDIAKKNLVEKETQEKSEIEQKLNTAIEKVNKLAEDESNKIEVEYTERVVNLQVKIDSLKESYKLALDKLEKINEIKTTITKLEQNVTATEMEIKSVEETKYDDSQLFVYKSRKKELEDSLVEMNKEMSELQNEQTLCEFWKAAWSPSGIPSMLIDEAIPFMNERVSEYLDILSNGRYIVSFDTLAATKSGEYRDKISVNVLDTYTRANSRIQLSGGQTRLVDIATILTLGDLQSNVQDVKINILLFDEIFDSLDEENIGFVSKILSQLKLNNQSI